MHVVSSRECCERCWKCEMHAVSTRMVLAVAEWDGMHGMPPGTRSPYILLSLELTPQILRNN